MVGKLKRSFARLRHSEDDIFWMDIRENVDWMHLAQDRDQWQTFVNTVMNLWIPQKVDFLTEWLLASQEGLSSIQLVQSAGTLTSSTKAATPWLIFLILSNDFMCVFHFVHTPVHVPTCKVITVFHCLIFGVCM